MLIVEILVGSLKSSSGVEKWKVRRRKVKGKEIEKFFEFRFFEELSRFKVLCEHLIFGMIILTFRGIFFQIKIVFYKNSYSK